ncbi:hypothetical protein H9P43_000750 [Blastocladiella emersonii ATCC 22665]|nr:hypothetical protein H9P43_000750 [Blastocladiella emersonii ATCC 22665]
MTPPAPNSTPATPTSAAAPPPAAPTAHHAHPNAHLYPPRQYAAMEPPQQHAQHAAYAYAPDHDYDRAHAYAPAPRGRDYDYDLDYNYAPEYSRGNGYHPRHQHHYDAQAYPPPPAHHYQQQPPRPLPPHARDSYYQHQRAHQLPPSTAYPAYADHRGPMSPPATHGHGQGPADALAAAPAPDRRPLPPPSAIESRPQPAYHQQQQPESRAPKRAWHDDNEPTNGEHLHPHTPITPAAHGHALPDYRNTKRMRPSSLGWPPELPALPPAPLLSEYMGAIESGAAMALSAMRSAGSVRSGDAPAPTTRPQLPPPPSSMHTPHGYGRNLREPAFDDRYHGAQDYDYDAYGYGYGPDAPSHYAPSVHSQPPPPLPPHASRYGSVQAWQQDQQRIHYLQQQHAQDRYYHHGDAGYYGHDSAYYDASPDHHLAPPLLPRSLTRPSTVRPPPPPPLPLPPSAPTALPISPPASDRIAHRHPAQLAGGPKRPPPQQKFQFLPHPGVPTDGPSPGPAIRGNGCVANDAPPLGNGHDDHAHLVQAAPAAQRLVNPVLAAAALPRAAMRVHKSYYTFSVPTYNLMVKHLRLAMEIDHANGKLPAGSMALAISTAAASSSSSTSTVNAGAAAAAAADDSDHDDDADEPPGGAAEKDKDGKDKESVDRYPTSLEITLTDVDNALPRKRWKRLQENLQLWPGRPNHRNLSWKSCTLIIVPREQWREVFLAFHLLSTQHPITQERIQRHQSARDTFNALSKVYQTRRSRCGLTLPTIEAFVDECGCGGHGTHPIIEGFDEAAAAADLMASGADPYPIPFSAAGLPGAPVTSTGNHGSDGGDEEEEIDELDEDRPTAAMATANVQA